MTVYVLMLEYDCEPSYIMGVYSTLEKAREARTAMLSKRDTGGSIAIYSVEADAAPLDCCWDRHKEIKP